MYCIVVVCERVHAVWITYFGVAIYIGAAIYISEPQQIFQSRNAYFRAAIHISGQHYIFQRRRYAHGEDTVRTTSQNCMRTESSVPDRAGPGIYPVQIGMGPVTNEKIKINLAGEISPLVFYILNQTERARWAQPVLCDSAIRLSRHIGGWQRSICRKIVVYTGIQFDFTLVGQLLDTRVALLTLTRVATRLESSRTMYHIDYILHIYIQCTNQDKVWHLEFLSRTCHSNCSIIDATGHAQLLDQSNHRPHIPRFHGKSNAANVTVLLSSAAR